VIRTGKDVKVVSKKMPDRRSMEKMKGSVMLGDMKKHGKKYLEPFIG